MFRPHAGATRRTLAVVSLLAALLGGAPAVAAPADAADSGVNDWSCQPSASQPEPVVLLHGLTSNGDQNWTYHAPRIAAAGYCVFSLTYGTGGYGDQVGGLAPIDESAREIGAFIDRVLAATGANEVHLVGHSEGAFQSLYVPKVTGYADRVNRVVALAPPTHGTSVSGLVTLGQVLGGQSGVELITDTLQCPACADLVTGGAAVDRLTDGPIAQPGVGYTVIASRYDVVVTPPSTSFVHEAGVTNYYVQDKCPFDFVGHVGFAFDSGVTSMILNGLDGDIRVRCGFGAPF